MRQPGLRARITAGFAAGALCLAMIMAVLSYQITRHSLLREREDTAVRAASYDAAIVRAGIRTTQPDIAEILSSIDTGENRRVVLHYNGRWYGRTADPGITSAVPVDLQQRAGEGHTAIQRIRLAGEPTLVVAVPVADTTTYYEVDSLQELDRTLQLVSLILTLVAIGTALIGAALGWYAGRYVMRPVARVTQAARDIAAGQVQARLDPATEPDLAQLTRSFNDMVDQLAARLEKDRRFAADVSHELRSPLQTLAAAASVLTRGKERLDTRTATAAGLVADEVERFQALVEDLLSLSRGERPAERGAVDVRELAGQVCRARELSEEVISVEGPRVWLIDRRRVEQLLVNLLDNADAYGGGPIAVRFAIQGCDGVIEVDDDGPGVSPDDRVVIFDRFVRGRAAHARANSYGTGLGLALVAQHATAHGGTTTVLDRPGGGARFRVTLTGCLP
ncbi:HAMP domain-containing histidine kinase [Actinoplanes sp. TBRC 11911]|uniref:sensor histidine kinase n=1 Tax=Actinoplanes sp. TBRC 11911 TaxID=2729386 RepID=UPI00145D5009|nr:HAMP domain-containing sensor histidine kinase [Actinoplanes sp. TBRC 11911]NMO54293.1 HAMP domain-containing histidine kinase [Actinoplanes sp. TBRC 11911]